MGESSVRDHSIMTKSRNVSKYEVGHRFRFMRNVIQKHRPIPKSKQLDFTRRQLCFSPAAVALAAAHAGVELPQHKRMAIAGVAAASLA